MKKEIIHPENAGKGFTTGAYSAAVEIDGWVYISGQGPIDFTTSEFRLGSIEEETRLTMHNIQSLLKVAGCTMDDLVKCTVHLADINDFAGFNNEYSAWFTGVKPARTTVQSGLGYNIKVEIDAIARKPKL
ncbi:MAG: RidA family protein [Pseudobacter sp.]|uniref:RidA family protein n=1 Tax=Pseudobacter sp. TaxID=2045420 RepID=UPI003F7CEBFB